jgi:acetolactate synthase-1/3 small subunit
MSVLKIKHGSSSHTVHDLRDTHSQVETTHCPSFIVESDSGPLAQLIGNLSGRADIDNLSVADGGHSDQRNRAARVTLKSIPEIGSRYEGSV